MADEVKFVRGKNVVAAISFREATIYPTDASPGQRPEHVVAPDPRGRFHKVQHRAGNPDGVYEGDSPESHHWIAFVEKHRKDVAAKIVADVRIDIDHLDDRQVLEAAMVAGESDG